MRLRLLASSWSLLLCAPALAQKELAPRDSSRPSPAPETAFALPAGLEARVWAESPALYNPTAICFDARGRLWVTEAVNYRRWNGRNPGLQRPEGDRVVILEDTDGDGVCDSSKTFVQEQALTSPLGILVLGKRVFVSCSPDLIVYTDENGDDLPDQREVLLTGFGGPDHDHGLHSLIPGPDGSLYTALGNAGPHLVRDRSGWSLRSGSLYNDGGRVLADNKPGLVSDDGRAWTGGLMLRLEPDGTGLKVLAHNFRNPYELALDSFGNLFTSDNDDDGNQGCRALRIVEGADHGYFSADGTRFWNADRRPGQETRRAHWHQDDPGVAPMGTLTGAGGPTGVTLYEGELLARWIGGHMLAADAGRGAIFALRPEVAGAGHQLELSVLIEPKEGGERARWFRPSDVAVAPDGSVHVADWYDPGVGGHGMGDQACYGRIVRIAPVGAQTARARPPDLSTPAGAAAALASPALAVREAARAALVQGGGPAVDPMVRMARSGPSFLRARGLWVLARLGEVGQAEVERALADPDPQLRLTAFRALRREGALTKLCKRMAADQAPLVRAEVAAALRDLEDEQALPLWLQIASASKAPDRHELAALGVGAHGREAALYDAWLGERAATPEAWSAKDAELAWLLHPAHAVSQLAARASATQLELAARLQALDALAFIPERAAGEAMLQLALVGPPDTRAHAEWWLRHRDRNAWREHGFVAQLPGAGLEQAQVRWSSGVIRSGAQAFDVDVRGARSLWLLVEAGPEGNGHDWADWLEPRLLGPAGERRLTDLPWLSASAGWGEVRVGRNTGNGPLAVDGATPAFGIGTHARSLIHYRLPEGCERFVGGAGPDDGGTRQPGARTQLEFRILVDAPRDRAPVLALERTLRDARASADARLAAGRGLAALPEGGMLLVRAAQDGVLNAALREALAPEIARHPDPAVVALAAPLFPLARKPAPTRAELLALAGDPRRGRNVFLSESAGCARCHTFRGQGGAIGPDLTEVRAKLDRAAIVEALLDPSAAIAFGYDTWMISTADDELFTGFLLADGADLLIKDTQGALHAIPAKEVVERRKQTLSTMPDGLAAGLEPQALADLVALLVEDTSAPATRGPERVLFDGKSLAGWVWHGPPGSSIEDAWSVRDGVLVDQGEPIGYIRTAERFESFELTLEWRFDPARGAGNSGVLLRVQAPDEVWPRSIECQLHSGNAGDFWNIGAFGMQVDAARTSGRRTLKLAPSSEHALGSWNRYRILLDGERLSVWVNGVLQNSANWCEELPGHIALQAEGAYIEFRDIRLVPLARGATR